MMAVIAMLGAGSRAAAQSTGEQIAFDRPEAWALKYFAAVTTFTRLGPPEVRKPGSVDLGLEAGWVPYLSEEQRRVGFEGTKVEGLNKTPVYGRVRVAIGLPAGITADLGWIPPVEINGAKPNFFNAALERPFFQQGPWALGLRVYGQFGYGRGDYTCPADVASQPPGSPANPYECNEPSNDMARLNDLGGALTGGVRLGTVTIHFAGGGTYNDLQFQTHAITGGVPDNTLLTTHGWTGWAAVGVGFSPCERLSLAVEAFYSPLWVTRPPSTESQNDGLFSVRGMLTYRLF